MARSGLPRLLDRILAGFSLVLLAPVMAVTALAVGMTSRGPVLFRQQRIGRHGRPFTMLKFRTMQMNAEDLQVTAAGDERVTVVGRVLRRFKLDELPELFNVVCGDLSLVGPRPEVQRYVDLQDPRWKEVLQERPGITHPVTLRLQDEEGLIAEAGGAPERFYVEKLQPFKLEGYLAYQDVRSAVADLRVLAATAAALVGWRWYPPVRLDEVQRGST